MMDFNRAATLDPHNRLHYYPENYSAKVFLNPDANYNKANFPRGLLCQPLDLEVSTYALKASNQCNLTLALDYNGEKYWGIASDKFNDKLYITDRLKNSVIQLDPIHGTPIHKFGQAHALGSKGNNLFRPTGLVVDNANKRVLICDKDHHRIAIYSKDGQFISTFGNKGHGPGEFNYPWDIDISPNGEIAVSDTRNHRIQFFDRFGNYLKRFSVFETSPFEFKDRFDYPRGITFGKDRKSLFITDFNINNVIHLDVDSLKSRLLVPPGNLFRPQGIIKDHMNNLIVCDSRRNIIRVMSQEGKLKVNLRQIGWNQIYCPVDACNLQGGLMAVLNIQGKIYIF